MGKAIIISNVDFSKTGLGAITVHVPLQSLAITGESSVTGMGQYQVAYTPSTTHEKGIVWSVVSGSEYATIDQDGIVTALSGAVDDTVTIRATSSVNPNIYEDKTISVTYSGMLLNIHKVFGGTAADVIETNFKLFDSSMPDWTLFVYAPDALSGSAFQTAVHCMDESGSPWSGLTFNKVNNSFYRGVSVDFNGVNNSYMLNKKTRVFSKGSVDSSLKNPGGYEMPIGISRQDNRFYYTVDGEIWRQLDDTFVSLQNTLVIGAYRDANGDLGRFYNSNGRYLDVILYSTAMADAGTFFSTHGVKPAIYTLNNHTCDRTAATAVNTGLKPFDSESYPNGVLIQVDLTLPDVPVAIEQAILACREIGQTQSTPGGFKLINYTASKVAFNCVPGASFTEAVITRGSRHLFAMRLKSGDVCMTFDDTAKEGNNTFDSKDYPLTIGGELSALPDTWHGGRFAACIIHNMTIREL